MNTAEKCFLGGGEGCVKDQMEYLALAMCYLLHMSKEDSENG